MHLEVLERGEDQVRCFREYGARACVGVGRVMVNKWGGGVGGYYF